MLPPPCAYTHHDHGLDATKISLSYLEQWKQTTKNKKHFIVFDAVWWNSNSDNNSSTTTTCHGLGLLLMACTNTGEIIIWKQTSRQEEEADVANVEIDLSETVQVESKLDPIPMSRIQVSSGVLYSMKMVTFPSQKTVLMVSGDEGILLLDWSTWWNNNNHNQHHHHPIMDTMDSSPTTATTTVTTTIPRLARYQTYPSPQEESVEINDFDLLLHSQYIMGAAGDAFGAYKWNLETQQLVATFPSALQPSSARATTNNHHPYMHSIKTLHSNNHSNDDKLVLMGGEGGLLSLWDGQQDACIEKWNLATTPMTTKSTTGTAAWISSIETLSNDTWWIAGGGISAPASTSFSSASTSGFWSAFHGPTRSRITVPPPHKNHHSLPMQQHPQQQYTRAPITKIVATESSSTSWYSVGLEGVVRQWSLSSSMESSDKNNNREASGVRRHSVHNHSDTSSSSKSVWCDLPCAYTIACSSRSSGNERNDNHHDDDSDYNMVAIGGVGSVVNVFKDYNGALVADQSLFIT